MVCDAPYLQNEFGDPDFVYVFNIILSFSTCSQSFKKICTWELLGANVLTALRWNKSLEQTYCKSQDRRGERFSIELGILGESRWDVNRKTVLKYCGYQFKVLEIFFTYLLGTKKGEFDTEHSEPKTSEEKRTK